MEVVGTGAAERPGFDGGRVLPDVVTVLDVNYDAGDVGQPHRLALGLAPRQPPGDRQSGPSPGLSPGLFHRFPEVYPLALGLAIPVEARDHHLVVVGAAAIG